jgi:hypothetical protein
MSRRGSWTTAEASLLHAGRVRFDLPIAGLAQADVVEDLMGALHGVAVSHSPQFAGVGHELDAHGAREQAFILGHEAHRLANIKPPGPHVHAENFAAARVDGNEPEQAADERGLARAVGPQEPDRSFGDFGREFSQRGDLAVAFGDIVQLKKHRGVL